MEAEREEMQADKIRHLKIKAALLAPVVFLLFLWVSNYGMKSGAEMVGAVLGTKEFESEEIIPESREVKILFFGDLMFDRYIRQVSSVKGGDFIFQKVSDLMSGSDLVVANLEGPITENKSVSVDSEIGSRNNYIFTFEKNLPECLARNNIGLVNLGNNHILNFGKEGLARTKEYLEGSGIGHFGHVEGPEGASVVRDVEGIKVAFVSYNEFARGSEETALEKIRLLKDWSDVLVVYAHWDREYEKISRPSTKELARKFVDHGADLVIGSHPHVVQDQEDYKGKRIYYSLGNFVFDQYFDPNTQEGLAVGVSINSADFSMKFEETALIMERSGQTRVAGK